MTYLQNVLSIIAIIFLIRIYLRFSTRWCKSNASLKGKTAIVTGSNTGIGYQVALDFARRGARVILACRNKDKADRARQKITCITQNPNVVVKLVDFLSFDSVRHFAHNINETEPRLDILVNNAGACSLPPEKTVDGHLMMLQTNYLSPFLLTQLLGNLLKRTGASRIVNVSSVAAKSAKIKINALNTYKGDNQAYCISKLCNILFTRALSQKLKGSSSGVTVFSVHPGYSNSEIYRNLSLFLICMYRVLFRYFFKTCEEGAQTVIHLSVSENVESYSGEHFYNCKRVPPYSSVQRYGLAEELWAKTAKLVNLQPSEAQL